ncbi:MAG: HAMP domain-containing protein, partial [Rhodospirillales bacterium]
MPRIVTHLRIRGRILGGFGFVLLLLIGVAAFLLIELRSLTGTFDAFAADSHDALDVTEIKSDVAELRYAANRFIVTAEDADYEAAIAAADALSGRIDTVTAEMGDDAQRALMRQVRAADRLYKEALTEIAGLTQQRDSILNQEMVPAGQDLIRRLQQLNRAAFNVADFATAARASQAQEEALQAQLAVVRYLDTNSPADAETARTHIANAAGILAGLAGSITHPERLGFITEGQALLQQYGQKFQELAQAITLRNQIRTSRLDAAGTEMGALIDRVQTAAQASQAAVRAESMAAAQTIQMLALIVTVAGVALGAMFAWWIGSGLARPIVAMTGAMQRLADGDTGIEIPGVGRNDEIGEMAGAVQVFKDNRIEADRL